MKTFAEFISEGTSEKARMDAWVKKTLHMYSGTDESKLQFSMNSRNLGFRQSDIDYGWKQIEKARFKK
ncbi:hypothetical protein SEA1_gp0128 [Salmonella phage SEA1]|nr:hypothetical protein SEA1_gp0128 [Salmonella phage SEA1]